MSATPTATPTSNVASATATERVQQHRRYLMCRPSHFTVSYSINPWMEPSRPTDTDLAVKQWQALYDTYVALGHEIELIDPLEGLPDMVYTANGGFVIDGIAYGPKFRFRERAAEAPAFIDWFAANGFEVAEPVEVNEGEGDFLLVGDTILAGTGFRSTGDSHREVGEVFSREVVSLTLTDPRFYHLDTAISVLDPVEGPGGVEKANIAYLPTAFDEKSQAILRERYPDAIRVSDADGAVFGLNSASDGKNVIISPRAVGFEAQLRERGYTPVMVDLSELLLGGGGIKCCTLELRGGSR
ncbi:N-dimethylarginine dimethylaminohydrolase [Microbacterium sp. P26]|uniref:N-dimethylarginine dimethylaminohydrolase n=1 Tax=Microbacterium algihabitans TaxID=3075992 RepID=A0ABU3RYQ3_9MICO|nr:MULTISPECIES: dimethylargininase [unclassified Microbacterium]MCD2171014.1 N-dimethylarginine dimethylaminohydrolase [Microbacterium sp. JC 701]MCM3502245.1 N-dimethylarginine dimethylaminohydrolase [Microbacterium sp. P26]MDU0327578.1 N-dimethylarginine dimethylaminohydrolase [Microbacterium sp. KSW2-21]